MKKLTVTFVAILAIFLLFVASVEKSANLHANAQAPNPSNCSSVLPSFLENGKTYNFTFVVGQGDYSATSPFPLAMTGRIEKMEPQSGWLYINHYFGVRKGKNVEWKYEGYSWINFKQVFQCTEKTNNP